MAVRVLQVVPSYYPAIVYGGPIFSIHYTCQALARSGVEVRVATTNANGSTRLDVSTSRAVEFEPNYSVRYYNDTVIGRFSLAFTLHMWHAVKAVRLIHLQDVFSTYAVWTMLLANVFRKPILISARGEFSPWGLASRRPWLKKAWLMLLVRPLVRNSHRVAWHATSEAECGEILVQFPNAHVHVVSNGINCAAFDAVSQFSKIDYHAKFLPDIGITHDRVKILVALGRLHPVKGFDIAIQAFHRIAQKHLDMVLLIAGGDDGARKSLENLIRELGLEKRVSLVGEVRGDDKIAFLKGADILLFPSHSESFGMACLEALAAGLPVVASRNTPWSELEAERSGRWVDNTPEAFAETISNLLLCDLSDMHQAARKHAACYDLEIIATSLKHIYKGLLDEQRT